MYAFLKDGGDEPPMPNEPKEKKHSVPTTTSQVQGESAWSYATRAAVGGGLAFAVYYYLT